MSCSLIKAVMVYFQACHEVVSGPISQYIPLGTQDTADFEYNGDQLTLVYTDTTQNQ